MLRLQSPLDVSSSGRVRFEPIDDHVLRARVQATFDALLRAGFVGFSSDASLPAGSYRAIELRGQLPFKHTALVAEGRLGEPEQFWVQRSGGWLRNASQLAGPFSVMPFSPVPAESGTPVPMQLFVQDLKHRPIEIPIRPKKDRPLELPPGVPAFPITLAEQQGRGQQSASVLGFIRGFMPQQGAQLAFAA